MNKLRIDKFCRWLWSKVTKKELWDKHSQLIEETKRYIPQEEYLDNIKNKSQLIDYYSRVIRRLIFRLDEENRIISDKRKAEISNLQNQINPHFLYNTLETIRSEAIMHKDYDVAMMSEALANYFRYNISKKSDIVTIREELENIESYISIQKFRFKKRIEYETIFYDEREVIENAQMPKLILQPLVENSIYHGIEKNINGGKVCVHLSATDQRIIIIVEDNGPGMTKERLAEVQRRLRENNTSLVEGEKPGGIALMNINQRIKMIYGEEYGLTYSSVEDFGTEAELVLPLIAKEKYEGR
jgi:two-component system sensor histidine kinase YesM